MRESNPTAWQRVYGASVVPATSSPPVVPEERIEPTRPALRPGPRCDGSIPARTLTAPRGLEPPISAVTRQRPLRLDRGAIGRPPANRTPQTVGFGIRPGCPDRDLSSWGGGDRTHDLRVQSATLLPLSYSPMAIGAGLEPTRFRLTAGRFVHLGFPIMGVRGARGWRAPRTEIFFGCQRSGSISCGPRGSRTPDRPGKNRLLFQLSYESSPSLHVTVRSAALDASAP